MAVYGNVNVKYAPCKSVAQLHSAADYILGKKKEQLSSSVIKTKSELYNAFGCNRDNFANSVLMTKKMHQKKYSRFFPRDILAQKLSISFHPEDWRAGQKRRCRARSRRRCCRNRPDPSSARWRSRSAGQQKEMCIRDRCADRPPPAGDRARSGLQSFAGKSNDFPAGKKNDASRRHFFMFDWEMCIRDRGRTACCAMTRAGTT